MNFYNEIDPFAAAWLRKLIEAGHIAPGVVDERSIEDITPDELKQFTQCHFFAGIGVWSHALRNAGWSDDRPVWTGSCPCQPFSTAGKGGGFADERHLWPSFHYLIAKCQPAVVFGEQVDAAVREGWLDLVQADMEGIGYAFQAVGLPACGFGAPHIRQRLFFVGNSSGIGRQKLTKDISRRFARVEPARREQVQPSEASEDLSALGYAVGSGLERHSGNGDGFERRAEAPRPATETSGVGGFWRSAEWLACRDAKYRPIEPGTFPLADGPPALVGRLRGYGNAIVAPVAQAFIESAMEAFLED